MRDRSRRKAGPSSQPGPRGFERQNTRCLRSSPASPRSHIEKEGSDPVPVCLPLLNLRSVRGIE